MMTTTRPNFRLIDLRDTTSPQTRRRVQWDVLTIWTAAIGFTVATWAGFLHLLTR